MLRVAILSSWHVHADGYAREFIARPDVKVNVMWDEDPEKGKEFASRYNLEFEPDLNKLLARDDVDAVCVNAPTNIHRDVMVAAAKAGKHIFTEKVLTTTAKEAQDVRKAVEENGIKFCISFPQRTTPNNLLAKKILDEGLLGTVSYLRIRNAHNGASAGWLPPHFYDEVQCGGGAMMDLGAHPMYLIGWLLGKPSEITSAFTYITSQPVEDNAVSVMKYSSGAIAVSETGFVTSDSPFVMEIHGTAGSFTIIGGEATLKSNNAPEDCVKINLPEALPGPIAQFVDGVLHGKEILFGMDDAILLTEIMEAAYKAHRQGGFVKI